MYYSAYEYHTAPTDPMNNTTNHIFGLELEIDDDDALVRQTLDELIEEGLITVPWNEGTTDGAVVLENDASVYKEVIFCADTVPNLLRRLKGLNDGGLNPLTVANTRGTSAHIHFNREYLRELGITEENIFKMIEFLNPIIYAISGRDKINWKEWAKPSLDTPEYGLNWKNRGSHTSNISQRGTRYTLANTQNEKTVELRGFSNYCSFDYDTIKFFFEFAELIIDMAVYMKGKYYYQSGEELSNICLNWFKNDKPEHLEQILPLFAKPTDDIRNIYNEYYQLRNLHSAFRRTGKIDFQDLAYLLGTHTALLKAVYRLTLTPQGCINAFKKCENAYYKQLQGALMGYYYSTPNLNTFIGGR